MELEPHILSGFDRSPAQLMGLDPVSLKGLDKVKLMNRVDSKYIFHLRQLDEILEEVRPQYSVLEIEGKRLFDYASLYFDTPDYSLYFQHHNGRANRVKMRYRQYLDTGDVFFEVKKKIKGVRTDKYRVREPLITDAITPAGEALLDRLTVPRSGLVGMSWIYYKRITLAAHASEERATIDLAMKFVDENGRMSFDDLVIAEVKQARFSRHSPIVQALHARRIQDFRVSKYSLAVAMMVPGIKTNAFKPKIYRLNKILDS